MFIQTVLTVRRFWWTSGMIPEKVIWVRFPDRINAVYSKLLPINDNVFQFLIKHLHISYKRSYKISEQEMYSAVTSHFVILEALCNNSLSHFVIPDTLCNNSLSHFIIPDALCKGSFKKYVRSKLPVLDHMSFVMQLPRRL